MIYTLNPTCSHPPLFVWPRWSAPFSRVVRAPGSSILSTRSRMAKDQETKLAQSWNIEATTSEEIRKRYLAENSLWVPVTAIWSILTAVIYLSYRLRSLHGPKAGFAAWAILVVEITAAGTTFAVRSSSLSLTYEQSHGFSTAY